MSTYIGKIQIGNNESSRIPIGSTLFGTCVTQASTTAKQVTLDDFDAATPGVTVHIKFTNGNTATSSVTLAVGGVQAIAVSGNCVCAANEVLSFTLDSMNSPTNMSAWVWRVNTNAAQAGTVTPSAIGTAAVGDSERFARENHVHSISVATGDANGQVKIAGQNVSVAGLGDAAYQDVEDFATAAQGALAESAAQLSGATFTGEVIVPDITAQSNENAAATKEYVDAMVSDLLGSTDAMVFKGTIGANGTINTTANPAQTLPKSGYQAGWTYRVITAGTYAGQACEIGDLIIAINDGPETAGVNVINADWTIAQGNLDGVVIGPVSSTATHVARFKDSSGKEIEDSGYTIATSVPSGAVFRDTTYTLTTGANAYTSNSTMSDSDTTGTVLVSASQGVLQLQRGIKFSTTAVGTGLSPSVAGATT